MVETYKKITAVSNGDASLSEKVTLYLFHKYSDKRLGEIGGFIGIGKSAVSDASAILRNNMSNNKKRGQGLKVENRKRTWTFSSLDPHLDFFPWQG